MISRISIRCLLLCYLLLLTTIAESYTSHGPSTWMMAARLMMGLLHRAMQANKTELKTRT